MLWSVGCQALYHLGPLFSQAFASNLHPTSALELATLFCMGETLRSTVPPPPSLQISQVREPLLRLVFLWHPEEQ